MVDRCGVFNDIFCISDITYYSDVNNVLQFMELTFARVYILLLLKSDANAKIINA